MITFFFPDSVDVINPDYDFAEEEHNRSRLRIHSEAYPHEIYETPPYDGMLVSKAIVENRYTMPQRQRLLRQGIRKFLKLDSPKFSGIKIMGDCGSFSYRNESEPPYSIGEIFEFYHNLGFDYGISLDHIIFAYEDDDEEEYLLIPEPKSTDELIEWKRRKETTLALANSFIKECLDNKANFHPIGVAHGWNPSSYADSFSQLQKMGFDYIALGGLVPLKSDQIGKCLEKISEVKKPKTKIHLLGISRLEGIVNFQKYGVTSADSTAPLVQAFKSDTQNYHLNADAYIALRVPQVEGNTKLRARILSGQVNQADARSLERECLSLLNAYDNDETEATVVVSALCRYEAMVTNKRPKKRDAYLRTLLEKPWKSCQCPICQELGIHVAIFRGAERNRRRGFHNLYNYYQTLKGGTKPHS